MVAGSVVDGSCKILSCHRHDSLLLRHNGLWRDVKPPGGLLIVAFRNYHACNGITLYAADADWRLVMTNGMHISYLPKGPSKDVGPARSLVEIADDILEHLTGMGGTLVSSFAVPKVS